MVYYHGGGRAYLAHAEHRGLRAHGEELKDGEHAARRDVVAVDEALNFIEWVVIHVHVRGGYMMCGYG